MLTGAHVRGHVSNLYLSILKLGPLDRIFVETTQSISRSLHAALPLLLFLLFCADPISPFGISEINGCRLIRLNSHILQLYYTTLLYTATLPHSIYSAAPRCALFCHVMFPLSSLSLSLSFSVSSQFHRRANVNLLSRFVPLEAPRRRALFLSTRSSSSSFSCLGNFVDISDIW